MSIRCFLAIVMAGTLTLGSLAARPTVLGVVVAAHRARLNTTALTNGATVYDGDRLSTEAGGLLRVQSGQAIVALAAASEVSVRYRANGAPGLETELGKGTLVFSTAQAASLNVIVLEASIRPVADTQTFAQVSVTGPKELRICARRGALQFSYRGETETIAEGKTYRVILDPPDANPKQGGHVWPTRWPKGFKIVIIGEATAIVVLAIHELLESPDRP